MIHRVCTHVQLYCTYGFRPHTLKVKNTLASSSTTKFLKICVNAYNYNNKPIKKLAEFQKNQDSNDSSSLSKLFYMRSKK